MLKKYVDLVISGIPSGSFSYIAHPDIFNFTGDDKTFYREMERLCVAAKEHNMPLEYNLLGASDAMLTFLPHFATRNFKTKRALI